MWECIKEYQPTEEKHAPLLAGIPQWPGHKHTAEPTVSPGKRDILFCLLYNTGWGTWTRARGGRGLDGESDDEMAVRPSRYLVKPAEDPDENLPLQRLA